MSENRVNRFSTLRRTASIRTQVETALREAISKGILSAGEHLNERELCDLLEVSRPALREALRRLEAEELIECRPHVGATVANPTLADALSICELRVELESLAARLAARFGDAAIIAEMGDAADGFRDAAQNGTLTDMMAEKALFYECLISAAANNALSRSLGMLRNRILLYRSAALVEPGRVLAVHAELKEIHTAIGARDPDRAEAATRAHISAATRVLTTALARQENREMSARERERIDFADSKTLRPL